MTDKIVGIYSIKSPTGRVYIGQSIDINARWGCYNRLKCKDQPKLYNSFMKYGVCCHEFEIIELCAVKFLDDREQYWGDVYDVLNAGLNSSLRMVGQIFSEETKSKIREKRKFQIFSPETRAKIGAKSKGRYFSIEARKKCSIASIGRPCVFKGKKLDERMMQLRFKNQYRSILQFDRDGKFIKSWKSVAEAGSYYSINKSNITSVCKKRFKTAGGYIWKYENEIQSNNSNI